MLFLRHPDHVVQQEPHCVVDVGPNCLFHSVVIVTAHIIVHGRDIITSPTVIKLSNIKMFIFFLVFASTLWLAIDC